MQAVIVAAGESSRFWPLNKKHKSQFRVLGKSFIFWTLKELAEKNITDIVIVIGPDPGIEKEVLAEAGDLGIHIHFVTQEKPLGTGNAIFLAKDLVKEPFFVFWPYKINAGEIIKTVSYSAKSQKSGFFLTGAQTQAPGEYGILKLENNKVVEIVENPQPGKEPSNIKILGNYFLQPDFFEYYDKLEKHHQEDFVDALNSYIKEKTPGLIILEKDPAALKYPWQALEMQKALLESDRLTSYISPDATLSQNVIINGKAHIESGVTIAENTVINGPCYIGKNCQIGASNVLRGPVNLEEGVRTGAFCEIKNSIIQAGTHLHSGYLGDSIIGRNCRVGAGLATANRRLDRGNIKVQVKGEKIDTGLTYLGAIIGDNTNIGIHCSLMPGVLIGANCNVWPHSFVRENIEDGTTYRAEFKEVKEKNE